VVAFHGADLQRILKEEFGIWQSLTVTHQISHRLALRTAGESAGHSLGTHRQVNRKGHL
jgi:hypothetical protein